jgi:aspartate ammonia-lyase
VHVLALVGGICPLVRVKYHRARHKHYPRPFPAAQIRRDSHSIRCAEKCIAGIIANRDRCESFAERSYALATAVAPSIGYDRAAQIAKKAQDQNKTIREGMLQEGIPEGEVGRILDLKRMTRGRKLEKAPS